MKQLVFLFLFCPCLVIGQNVRVKRKSVFIEDVKVGKVEVVTNKLNHSKYVYSDRKGNTRMIFEYVGIPSLLEGFDEAYYYTSLTIPNYGVEVYYNTEDVEITRRNLIPYFYNKGLIKADGRINLEMLPELRNLTKLPKVILDMLEEERQQKEYQDYILQRDIKDSLYLRLVDTKQLDLKHIRIPVHTSYFFEYYNIFQGEQLLGKIIARYYVQVNEDVSSSGELIKSGNPDVFFVNSKGGRVAYINSFPAKFRVHVGDLEFNQRKMFFLGEKNPSKKLETAVQWLIFNEKL